VGILAMIDDKIAPNPQHRRALSTLTSARRKAVVGALLLAVLLIAAASSWSQIQPVGAKAADDILRLLEGRSPGERGEAKLSKAKQARTLGRAVPKAPAEPQERVLGKIFPPETEIATPEELLAAQFPELPVEGDAAEFVELPQLAALGGPGSGAIPGMPVFVGGGGGSGGGGNGGGGNGDGGSVIPPGVIPQPPAVPEPGTWLLMLLGTFLCAAALRRHRRTQPGKKVLRCAPGS
jgi:hypothetical protein